MNNTNLNIQMILTHGGQGHLDDFVAASLAAYLFGAPIVRREPTERELMDPTVLVLDVGGRYEPDLGNLDHHLPQFRGQKENSFTLLAKWLGLEAQFGRFPWVGISADIDNNGPFAAAKGMGISPTVIFDLQNPVFGVLLKKFSALPELGPREGFYALLREIGGELLRAAESLERKFHLFDRHCMVIEVKGLRGLLNETPVAEKPTEGVERWIEERYGEEHGLAFSVSFDDRGPGVALFRMNDHPHVDFCRIVGKEHVTFTHPNGFIAKVDVKDEATWRALLEAAIE